MHVDGHLVAGMPDLGHDGGRTRRLRGRVGVPADVTVAGRVAVLKVFRLVIDASGAVVVHAPAAVVVNVVSAGHAAAVRRRVRLHDHRSVFFQMPVTGIVPVKHTTTDD